MIRHNQNHSPSQNHENHSSGSAPGTTKRLLRSQGYQSPFWMIEGVGTAGHRLDGEGAAAMGVGQGIAGVENDVVESRVHPDRDSLRTVWGRKAYPRQAVRVPQ